MADWLSSMQQTFEYYTVDPGTWKDIRRIDNVRSCTISRDTDAETLGSAVLDITESLGECYVRVYLVTIQNGVREKHPLGTFLIQTPVSSFDGKVRSMSVDAYTPLLELKENPPPIGYSLFKGADIMESAYKIIREQARAPVVPAVAGEKLEYDFVANTDDTWITFLTDLIAVANYSFALDDLGRILFAPDQETAALQPVWTYNDDNSSILYPDISIKHDIYEIPNVVEVVYTTSKDYNSTTHYARVINDDPNSPVSTINRGRKIIYRDTNPSLNGVATAKMIDEYANKLLKELSTLEYTVTYTHAYCPVRIGDCVRLNYGRAGLNNVKAKVVSQSIKCEPGCPVTETAVFTSNLWDWNTIKKED